MLTEQQRQLVLDNYNLPHFVMQTKFSSYSVGSEEYKDLVQEGYLGLCVAAERYVPGKAAFTTFSCNYIWGYIIRYLNLKMGWRFHYREREDTKFSHISYTSLNVSIDGTNPEAGELMDLIADRRNNYGELEAVMDLKPAFQKAHKKYGLKILDMLMLGMDQREIQNILGISQPTISRIISKAESIYFTVQNMHSGHIDGDIIELYHKKNSIKVISELTNTNISYVKRVLIQAGCLR